MFEVPPPFDRYKKPVFVDVLVSDEKMSKYVFGTLVGGEGGQFKVKIDTVILRQEGFSLENLKVSCDNPEEKKQITVSVHKEDLRVDEERTDLK